MTHHDSFFTNHEGKFGLWINQTELDPLDPWNWDEVSDIQQLIHENIHDMNEYVFYRN